MTEGEYLSITGAVVAAIAATASLGRWAWWLAKRTSAPRAAVRVGYGMATVALLFLLLAAYVAVRASVPVDHGSRAALVPWRDLLAALNLAATGVLVVAVDATWLAVWSLRCEARKAGRVVAPAILAILVMSLVCSLWCQTTKRDLHLIEPRNMLTEIRSAQEAYHAESGSYANVSSALAANASSNHATLYPQAPNEPGARWAAWGKPCLVPVCNSGVTWASLPIHVDGGIMFGYSMIAGRAGERPDAIVRINGRTINWPVPHSDWYIVTAVGDPQGAGTFITFLGSSFTDEVLVDYGAP